MTIINNKISIAVIIPAFNAEKTIVRALDSIIKQTILPNEVIVVDDGSTDDTCKVAITHRIADATTLKVIKKVNGGVASARNFGIKAAMSNYVALLDADDEFMLNHIENMLHAATIHPDFILYFSAIERVFSTAKISDQEKKLPDFHAIILSHCDSSCIQKFNVTRSSLFEQLIKGNFIATGSSMFQKITNGTLNLFNESLKYGEDRAFYSRLVVLGRSIFINEIDCRIHRDGNNISNNKNSLFHAQWSIQVLESLINDDIFLTREYEQDILLKQLSSSANDLLYFSSRSGFKNTLDAIYIHKKYAQINVYMYLKRIVYALIHNFRSSNL